MSLIKNLIRLLTPTRWNFPLRVVLCLLAIAACSPAKEETVSNLPTTSPANSSIQNAFQTQSPSVTVLETQDCSKATTLSGICSPSELTPMFINGTSTVSETVQEETIYPTIPAFRISSTITPVSLKPTSCSPELCAYSGQYFLDRPIALPGNDSIDVTYRFGSTQSGRRDPHHGVEFLNSSGTPVLAAADGVVVVAGDDRQPTSPHGVWPITFYGPYSYFYGNLVVIEHRMPQELSSSFCELTSASTQSPESTHQTSAGLPELIYTLYGHLSQISVQVGQSVKAGQEIGKVGMSGIAEGSHLHFEVRLGENTYKASRNPELWLKPHTDKQGRLMGGIAGRVLNSYGVNLQVSSIVIERQPDGIDNSGDFRVTLLSYEEKGLIGLAPFEESFGIGDLEAGWYRISYPHLGLQERMLEVFPGQLTVVTLR